MSETTQKGFSLVPSQQCILHKCQNFILNCDKQQRESLQLWLNPKRRRFSLRSLEHTFAHYLRNAKQTIFDREVITLFDSFRRLAENYKKVRFDCFARDEKVPIQIDGITYWTTPAQLNFFRWFITENAEKIIEPHMNQVIHEMKTSRSSNKKNFRLKKKKFEKEIHFDFDSDSEQPLSKKTKLDSEHVSDGCLCSK